MAVRDAGSIIRELRLATGMSQWDFCDGICSVQTLSNIENGKQAISPIVFQSLTEKCGEMINPYPQFVSLDDFQCYMAVSNVDFYIDSWQFSIALDELRKIEESYFAENKLYYHFMINHIKLCKRDPVYLCLMMMEKLILDKKVLSQDVDSFGGYIGGVFKKNVRDAAINLLFHSADLFEVKWNVENNYFYQNRRSLYIKLYGYQ